MHLTNRRKISLLISEFNQINQALFPLKQSENHFVGMQVN